MEKGGYVFIVTDANRTKLYTGVAESLDPAQQVRQIAKGKASGIPQQYTVLLHYEFFPAMEDADRRRQQLRKWSRERKEELVHFNNPGFEGSF